MNAKPSYLTADQVYQLNEKHGWFMYEDAQSNVSKEFAHDAIAMHERMRAAAPCMLDALQYAEIAIAQLCDGQDKGNECWIILDKVRSVIDEATRFGG